NPPPTPSICHLSLHDALPISPSRCPPRTAGLHIRLPPAGRHLPHAPVCRRRRHRSVGPRNAPSDTAASARLRASSLPRRPARARSEEHTSELQSLAYLVCRLL